MSYITTRIVKTQTNVAKMPRLPVENQIITLSVVKIAIKFSPCKVFFSKQLSLMIECNGQQSYLTEKKLVVDVNNKIQCSAHARMLQPAGGWINTLIETLSAQRQADLLCPNVCLPPRTPRCNTCRVAAARAQRIHSCEC